MRQPAPILGLDAELKIALLEVAIDQKSRPTLVNEVQRPYGDRLAYRSINFEQRIGLLREAKTDNFQYPALIERTEDAKLFLALFNYIFEGLPTASPIDPDSIAIRSPKLRDFLPPRKLGRSHNKEPPKSNVVKYPYNNRQPFEILTAELVEQGYADTKGATSSKNVFEAFDNKNIITHVPMPTFEPYPNKRIASEIKRAIESGISKTTEDLKKDVVVDGCHAEVTPSYVVKNANSELTEISNLYYTAGAVVDIVLATEFQASHKQVILVPVTLPELFKEATRILGNSESREALIVKDTILALLKIIYPSLDAHRYNEFTGGIMSDGILVSRDVVNGDGGDKVLRSIGKRRHKVARKLESRRGRIEMTLSQIEQIPSLYNRYSKQLKALSKIKTAIERIREANRQNSLGQEVCK